MKIRFSLFIIHFSLLFPLVTQGQTASLSDTVAVKEIMVTTPQQRRSMVEVIDATLLTRVAGAANNFENILKVLPGVQSGNELSSQYAVRGGSYDENLVYVNGVEIFRPMLTRTGQQEGLSFINPQMVSLVEFSTGGFLAEFGDKMSSVLNVQYKRPVSIGGSAEGGLLGAAAAGYFIDNSKKFSGVIGLRYKSSAYLLNTLDDAGEYNPTFYDVQTILHYDWSSRFSLHFFGSYALNRYDFIPKNRETSFATFNPRSFMMFNEGNERDKYTYLLGAITADYRPASNMTLSFTASGTAMDEQETLDILSEYWFSDALNESDKDKRDVGSMREHARNYLSSYLYQISHKGSWANDFGNLQWGLQAQWYVINDDVYQWKLLDSAGYMYPHKDGALQMYKFLSATHNIDNQRFTGYLQQSFDVYFSNNQHLKLTPSVRFCYSALNREWLISPRLQAIWFPQSNKQLQFFLAAGLYQQPPFYKEMKDTQAQLHTDIAAQRSLHFVLGGNSIFRWNDIPFKFTAEAYYKRLYKLIPYMQDNINLAYMPQTASHGRIYGCDVKLNATLTRDAESWVSVSLMQAQQDIADDQFGFLPLPNDQRLNISAMLQDRIPNNPHWQVYVLMHYGSSLPVFVPDNNGYSRYFKMPSYSRTDVGLTYVFFDKGLPLKSKLNLHPLTSTTLTFEVLNLFDIRNTSSYLWVQTLANSGTQAVAVPNYLTSRRFNVKLMIEF